MALPHTQVARRPWWSGWQAGRIRRLLAALEREDFQLLETAASGPNAMRFMIEETSEVQELLHHPHEAVQAIRRRWQGGNTLPDVTIAAYAYLLEKLSALSALPLLLAYVERNLTEVPTLWGPHLATHALKVLTNQEDLNAYYTYGSEERQRALQRARNYWSLLQNAR
jgi:hypothetical protein